MPAVQLVLERSHLLQGEVVSSCRRVVCVQDPGEDASHAEESQGAGKAGVFAGQGGLEALFGNVLIIRVRRVLCLQVLLLEHLGEAESGSRETVNGSAGGPRNTCWRRGNLPVNGVQGPEDLFPRLQSEGAKREALLALVEAEPLRQADGNSLVVLQAAVVGGKGAVEQGEDQALQGAHGVLQ